MLTWSENWISSKEGRFRVAHWIKKEEERNHTCIKICINKEIFCGSLENEYKRTSTCNIFLDSSKQEWFNGTHYLFTHSKITWLKSVYFHYLKIVKSREAPRISEGDNCRWRYLPYKGIMYLNYSIFEALTAF